MTSTSTGNEIVATSGRIPANPKIPCHGCGTEERVMTMKRSDDWTLTYPEENQWVAYCPECDSDE